MAIHVGLGSWADDAYVGVLYPPGRPRTERLHTYARTLSHVEVNATYYATPPPGVVRNWVKQTPEGFSFSVKLHRLVSQSPARVAERGVAVRKLLAAAQPLVSAGRLSAFLLVLPPRFAPDRHRLDELDELVRRLHPHPLAVELRHRDWIRGRQREMTLGFFRERKLVWVAVDLPRIAGSALMPPLDVVTNPAQAYLRLHGRNPQYLEAKTAAEGHTYGYAARELRAIATRARKLSDQADEVYVIANNHAGDFAPRTALALQRLLAPRRRA